MKNFYLYIILWACSCTIAATITILLLDGDKPADVILFDDKTVVYNSEKSSENIVNKLLLSADELKLSDAILVSPAYKHTASEVLFLNTADNENAGQVYSTIFKRKLEKVSKPQTGTDFYIKELPGNN